MTPRADSSCGATGVYRAARQWLHWLRYTPLHPQFLAYRHERMRYHMVGESCSGRVLDIGCGRQPLRDFISSNCEYIAMDYPATGISYGAKPAVHADASNLPFPDQTFDTVVCLEVLEHLRSPRRALLEAYRVVKPEGRVIVSTPFLYPIHDAPSDFRRWTSHGLELLCRASGFRVVSLKSLGTPIESGVLMLNLGWAWQALYASVLLRIPLIMAAVFMVPVMNLVGLVSSRMTVGGQGSPFAIGYIGVLDKLGDQHPRSEDSRHFDSLKS